MASSQVCSDAVLHDISKQHSKDRKLIPGREAGMEKNMRQEPLGPNKGLIVWNALERGHSLTEGELGKGGYDTGPRHRDERMSQ